MTHQSKQQRIDELEAEFLEARQRETQFEAKLFEILADLDDYRKHHVDLIRDNERL